MNPVELYLKYNFLYNTHYVLFINADSKLQVLFGLILFIHLSRIEKFNRIRLR